MLRVPKLDDVSYERLVERLRGKISLLTEEWTDLNHHDPGITILQLYAWLTDTLDYYLDATGEVHRLKYLKLLGLAPQRSAALCHLSLTGVADGEIDLPGGTRFAAGDTVFELEKSCRMRNNSLAGLYGETGGVFTDLTPFAGLDGGFSPVFTHDLQAQSAVYFLFTAPVGGSRFYVEVENRYGRTPPEGGLRLGELAWECWDGSHWREASVEDETQGFLQSGFVTLAPDGETAPLDHPELGRGYAVRARLTVNHYDVLPRLGRVLPCCVQARQVYTHAHTTSCTYTGGDVILDKRVRPGDSISVGVEEGGSYVLWYDAGLEPWCEVELLPDGRAAIRFDEARFGRVPLRDARLLVTAMEERVAEEAILGVTNGLAAQRLALDAEHISRIGLALVEERDGRPWFEVWELCDEIGRAPCDAKVFMWDAGSREVVFGDAIGGLQPPAGRTVVAIEIETSLLGEGNVRRGQVNAILDPVAPGLKVTNPADAFGGVSPKDSSQFHAEIEEKLTRVTRAVNVSDYAALVKQTPGLIIDRVAVISGRAYEAVYGGTMPPNTVLVAVQPVHEHEPRPVLNELYAQRIRAHLERYRLLTTNIEVIPARYLAVEIYGRLLLRENTREARRRVEELLRSCADFSGGCDFGRPIVYGRLFSLLEMLDCVRKVERLSLECAGLGGMRSEQGDIVVHPDTLPWLARLEIEYT